jgi:hypothetical protein
MPKVENPKEYVQSWNSRSKKYVLVKKGNRGQMTGKMSPEPFEDVPIVNEKPEPEQPEQQSAEESQPEEKQSDTSLKTEQNEQPKKEQEKKSGGWADIFGL